MSKRIVLTMNIILVWDNRNVESFTTTNIHNDVKSKLALMTTLTIVLLSGALTRSGPQFSDMTLSDCSVLIVPRNTGTDYD